jgi:hypothetical protein
MIVVGRSMKGSIRPRVLVAMAMMTVASVCVSACMPARCRSHRYAANVHPLERNAWVTVTVPPASRQRVSDDPATLEAAFIDHIQSRAYVHRVGARGSVQPGDLLLHFTVWSDQISHVPSVGDVIFNLPLIPFGRPLIGAVQHLDMEVAVEVHGAEYKREQRLVQRCLVAGTIPPWSFGDGWYIPPTEARHELVDTLLRNTLPPPGFLGAGRPFLGAEQEGDHLGPQDRQR